MNIQKTNLLNILRAIKPGLSAKGLIEQSDCFAFTGDMVITYNDRITIGYPFETDFDGAVSANELYKILQEISEEDIDLSVSEKNELVIKSKSTKAKLNLFETKEEIIQTINTRIDKWENLPIDFIEGISLCLFSTSTDMTQGFLTCLNIIEDKIISSDNLRISQFIMSSEMESFLLPASSAIELVKFDVNKYYLSDSWAYFKSDSGAILCSRIMSDEYPDVEGLLNLTGDRFKLPKDVQKAIKTASILAEGDFDIDKRIEITVSKDKIKCVGEREIGWVESEKDISFDGTIKFGIHPDFFYHVLNKATTAIYNEDKLLFKSGSFKHLVLLYKEG